MMWSRSKRAALAIAWCVQCVSIAHAASTAVPLSVTPSLKWYGDDGTWSAVTLLLGTDPQWVDVFVNTVSSETWVVDADDCPAETDCAELRGNTFAPDNSSSWQVVGYFDLGVDEQLGNTGYAEYGLDVLEFGTTNVAIPKAIIGSFNGTGQISTVETLLGCFGLGNIPGKFPDNTTAKSAISSLVEDVLAIPSYSYGYTAGAKYQQKGTPNSLTLGGVDANRFVPNNVTFSLNPSQNPQVYIDYISVTNNGNTTDLVVDGDGISAVIDSSTAYLWLPKAACERFADQLGLIYNDTLNLYLYNTSSQHTLLQHTTPNFTFSICDTAASPEIVNISLPWAAFDLELTFPAFPLIPATDNDSSLYYFPLRQAASEDQYVIGRVFLQEAYLITDYERNSFSVHQAVHTLSPITNTSIQAITRPSSGDLSPMQPADNEKDEMSKGAIAGMAIGVVAIATILTLVIVYWCRRRRSSKDSINDKDKVFTPPQPFLDRLRRFRRPALDRNTSYEATGDTTYPTEVGADAEHERFELPAPLGPAELDSEEGTYEGTTEQGSTQDSNNISAYERARRKLERQQLAAAQAQHAMESFPVDEKKLSCDSPLEPHPFFRATLEIPDTDGPQVSPVGGSSGGTSPVSPGFASSPVSPAFMDTPVSPITSMPPPIYQRINPANVVYAGRLPNNVQLPRVVPRFVGPAGRSTESDRASDSDREREDGNLGSRFTGNDDLYGSGDTVAISSPSGPSEESRTNNNQTMVSDPSSWGSRRRQIPDSDGRRLDSEDFIHVPQPAENRFSWEEERTEGTD